MSSKLISPAVLRRCLRAGLRLWGRTAVRGGWFYQSMEHLGPRLGESIALTGQLPNGAKVDCDLRDHVQRHLYFYGAYEPIEAFLFNRTIRRGDVVVDAGANIGQYSLLASTAVGSTGQVHSFEPVPTTYRLLDQNVRRNRYQNVFTNNVALWDENTTLDLGLSQDMADNIGSFSIGTKDGPIKIQSTAIRFDDYAAEKKLGRVAVVKMDIEGAELFALKGMTKTLERDRPTILAEVNSSACGSPVL